MARYTGPVCRLCRRAGMKLFLKGERCFGPKCAVERRNTPPGMAAQRRRKQSDYGLQLREKQKLRAMYGVLEAQFRNLYEEAARRPSDTGDNLLRLLEQRLDNVVYRLGFAASRRQARQLVRHGHILLNGRRTDIPSAQVKPHDVVEVHPKSKDTEYFKQVRDGLTKKSVPRWLELDAANLRGRVLAAPEREDIDTNVNEQLVIEFYSR
ncbi:MAG TPA: 30S ribosomal protein S4 [Chloroflexota bacterium]|jgi:small subunit ribosomal protein S4|nr:30S ribosomal protein S4 [Chloroflexota bacterium]